MNCFDIQNNNLVILDKKYNILKIVKYNNQKIDYYISLPWIDSHVHCNPFHKELKGDPDKFGINQGVGYIFDAGSTGINNLSLWNSVSNKCETSVNILLNISKKGITLNGELNSVSSLTSYEEIAKNKKLIKGLKLRLSGSTNKIYKESLDWSIKASSKLDLPLMIHIGNEPPDIKYILQKSNKNTILTHCFNGKKNNILKSEETIKILNKKMKEGLKLDIGHGSESFAFDTVQNAFKNNVEPFSISTDIYINNFNGPVYSLANVMSKLLYFGYSKKKILDCVTSNPAKFFKINEYPKNLKDGFTLFNIINKEIIVKDAVKNREVSTIKMKKIFVPKIIKHNNKIFKVKEETLYGKPL